MIQKTEAEWQELKTRMQRNQTIVDDLKRWTNTSREVFESASSEIVNFASEINTKLKELDFKINGK